MRKKQSHVQHALHKYGIDSFLVSVIDHADSREMADERERYWISELNCKTPNGYNLTEGGEGLREPSEETRRKIGSASKGRKHSAEVREAQRQRRIGTRLSEETKQKLRGRVFSDEHRKRLAVPKTEDHKNNISAALKGKEKSEATRQKISDAIKHTNQLRKMCDLSVSEKICPRCGELLPLTDFHKNKRRRYGVAQYCKKCKNLEYKSACLQSELLVEA